VQKSSYWHSPLLALDFLPSRQFPSARRIETERAAALGDNRWRELLEAFYARVREVLQLYRGREISTAGDGFFATFHGPARAIRCAGAIREAVRALGLDCVAAYTPGNANSWAKILQELQCTLALGSQRLPVRARY
jgi:hypothetical protein